MVQRREQFYRRDVEVAENGFLLSGFLTGTASVPFGPLSENSYKAFLCALGVSAAELLFSVK